MTAIRYYSDEHIARAIIRGLRQRGIDVLTVAEAGMLGASDMAHLRFAHEQRRVLFTQDADFLRLAASELQHFGIVYAAQRTSISAIVHGLVLIQKILAAEDMRGSVEYL